jgi:hypothetical protein
MDRAILVTPTLLDLLMTWVTIDSAVIVGVANGVASDLEHWGGVDQGARRPFAALQTHHRSVNGLMVDPGSYTSVIVRLRSKSPCNSLRLLGLPAGWSTIARISPVRIHNHRRPGAGLVFQHRGLQGAVGQILQPPINAQRQYLTGLRRSQALHILHHPAQSILNHPFLAGNATQLGIEGLFQTFLSGVVNVGKAQQLRGDFRIRVIATVFALGMYTRKS